MSCVQDAVRATASNCSMWNRVCQPARLIDDDSDDGLYCEDAEPPRQKDFKALSILCSLSVYVRISMIPTTVVRAERTRTSLLTVLLCTVLTLRRHSVWTGEVVFGSGRKICTAGFATREQLYVVRRQWKLRQHGKSFERAKVGRHVEPAPDEWRRDRQVQQTPADNLLSAWHPCIRHVSSE